MVDCCLSMKLIEISSNDILSYLKEEVHFPIKRGLVYS